MKKDTVSFEGSESTSSSNDGVLQSTAASARPSCRRRAALDSDSETEQTPGQSQQEGSYQLPCTSAYDFDVPSSGHRSIADAPQGNAAPSTVAADKRPLSSNVIVLESSDEENKMMTSCSRNSYLLCRWGLYNSKS